MSSPGGLKEGDHVAWKWGHGQQANQPRGELILTASLGPLSGHPEGTVDEVKPGRMEKETKVTSLRDHHRTPLARAIPTQEVPINTEVDVYCSPLRPGRQDRGAEGR
jgi:hypothetical protein